MVRVRRPLHSQAASGKISQTVHYATRRGTFARRLVSPAFEQTSPRALHQADIQTCNAAWIALTQPERDTWAALGDAITLRNSLDLPYKRSGHNWYVACNVRRLRLELTILATAPVYDIPIMPYAIDLTTDGIDQLYWSLDGPHPNPINHSWDIRLAGPLSPGRRPALNQARWLAYLSSSMSNGTIPDRQAGSYTIFLRSIAHISGLVSPWLHDTAIIDAAGFWLRLQAKDPNNNDHDLRALWRGTAVISRRSI